jgi:hypothetical protein
MASFGVTLRGGLGGRHLDAVQRRSQEKQAGGSIDRTQADLSAVSVALPAKGLRGTWEGLVTTLVTNCLGRVGRSGTWWDWAWDGSARQGTWRYPVEACDGVEGLVIARSWGFKSPLRHQRSRR